MHSRIFQVATVPVDKEDYISESDFCEHWFVESIADYVSSGNNRTEDIKHLRDWLEPNKVAAFDEKGGSFTVLPGGKEAYFAQAYKAFVAARAKTHAMGLPEFSSASAFAGEMWRMSNAFCDKFSYYVSSDEFETIPLDEFIRAAEPGTRYFIGGTLDYHF